jgi:hypothetical protein
MAAIRTDEWVNGIAQALNPVKVRVHECLGRARGQANGFYEMAGPQWRITTRDDGTQTNSVDSWD